MLQLLAQAHLLGTTTRVITITPPKQANARDLAVHQKPSKTKNQTLKTVRVSDWIGGALPC